MKPHTKNYINEDHEWIHQTLLHGRDPVLDGVLLLPGHGISEAEIWTQLKLYSEKYLKCKEDRSNYFHMLIDREIERNRQLDLEGGYPPAVCKKGCAGCCCQALTCTDDEARLILSYCAEHNIMIDYNRLIRQEKTLSFDKDGNFNGAPTWSDQKEEDQRCIFLDARDNTCIIWQVRPFVCRTQLAEETNRYCRPHNSIPDPRSKGIMYLECGYIVSAVFTIHRDSIGKTMCRLLLGLKQHGG